MNNDIKDYPPYLDYPIKPKQDPKDIEIKKLKRENSKLKKELEKAYKTIQDLNDINLKHISSY